MQALRNHFNHIMFLCKVKNAVTKSITAKQHQVNFTVVGGSLYMHSVYCTQNILHACSYIYLCEKVQNTVCLIYMACSHVQALLPVAYRGRGFGVLNPPPLKFRRYQWSPRSHKQEEPVSRFPFVVHCVLIRL